MSLIEYLQSEIGLRTGGVKDYFVLWRGSGERWAVPVAVRADAGLMSETPNPTQ
jgi:hypothetical protein